MKIGFVLDDSLDKTDGVQQYITTLGGWLTVQGHDVHYLVGQTRRQDMPHVHSLSRNLQVHFNQNRMTTPLPASYQKIKMLLKKEKFDVLHIQMPYSPFLAGRIIKSADKETVILGTFHIIPFSIMERLASKALGVILKRNLRRFDEIFSVSLPAQRFARQSFNVTTTVLPNVVAMNRFQHVKKLAMYEDDKLNIVYLGRLVERKGCLYLLRALQLMHVRGDLHKTRVLICGKGPLDTALKSFVTVNNLSKYIKFVGYISEEDKARYLATADIVALPSTGGGSFGIVLIEAMAAGADVVIAGDNVGYRSVLGDRPDQLIDPRDTEKFAATITHFSNNYRARQQARKWQEQHVKQYDTKVVGARLLKRYELLIAKRTDNSHN